MILHCRAMDGRLLPAQRKLTEAYSYLLFASTRCYHLSHESFFDKEDS